MLHNLQHSSFHAARKQQHNNPVCVLCVLIYNEKVMNRVMQPIGIHDVYVCVCVLVWERRGEKPDSSIINHYRLMDG